MKIQGILVATLFLAASATGFSQASQPPSQKPASQPAESTQAAPATTPADTGAKKTPDRAESYYHFTLAHMYEELAATYGRAEYASKAVEEYKKAIEADPTSEYLNASLAELYAKTGRIRDAVLEAQDIIKRDPKNVEARRLLGRIYLRSLGDMQSGKQSQNILKLAIEQYESIVQLQPDSVEDHLVLGRLYRLAEDRVNAEKQFRIATQLQPNSEEAVTTLAILYTDEGDYDRALKVLEAIPDKERTSKIYSALGFTYEQKKDYKKAIDAYSKAVQQDGDNLDALRGLAQNLLNDGQTAAALEKYKMIVDADPQDAQTYMRIAEIYRKDGKFTEALDMLKKAQAVVPDSLELPYNLAVIYQGLGRYDEAISTLQDLIQRNQRASDLYSAGERNNMSIFLERLGTIYREDRKPQQAVETFRKMTALGDDATSRAYQQIIDTYRENHQYKEATDAAQEATQKLPNDRGLKMVLGSQLADMGQADKGLAEVKSLLKGTPDDRDVYLALAQMYSRLRRFKEAEEAVEKAQQLAAKQDDKDYVNFIAGSIYEHEKKYEKAEETFRQVIANDPRNAAALNYLGYMMADRGEHLDDALNYIKRAVALDPQNGAYLDSLGWAYFKLGKYDLAEENLRLAVQRSYDDPTIHDHLADVYQKTGRLRQAIANWERALDGWNHSLAADTEPSDVAKVQKKLEAAKVKLAREGGAQQQ
ncbi:MAG: tetratricopeptide repeat protein [Terriglobia bacterium]|nr:tetratricopeptide repeat protein [Terriglobia bacterium]